MHLALAMSVSLKHTSIKQIQMKYIYACIQFCEVYDMYFCKIIMIFLVMYFILEQGAERKTRDEERRAAKRKLTATGSNNLYLNFKINIQLIS